MKHNNRRLALHYRALVIVAMRDAGMSLRLIGEYFLISGERVRQIVRRGPIPAQIGMSWDNTAAPLTPPLFIEITNSAASEENNHDAWRSTGSIIV